MQFQIHFISAMMRSSNMYIISQCFIYIIIHPKMHIARKWQNFEIFVKITRLFWLHLGFLAKFLRMPPILLSQESTAFVAVSSAPQQYLARAHLSYSLGCVLIIGATLMKLYELRYCANARMAQLQSQWFFQLLSKKSNAASYNIE